MKHFRLKTLIITLITLLAFLNMAGHTLAQDDQGEIIAEAPLTQVQAKPTSNLVLGETYYTIMFKTATAGAIKTVEMAFPAGFNLTGAKFIEKEIIGAGTLSVSGQTLIYTVSAATPPSIAAGKKIKIMVGGILNNTVTTPQVVTVTTKDQYGVVMDGPTASADPVLTQVQNLMIADGAVTSSKIADGTIGSADLAAGSVGSAQVADGSVTSADLAVGSVSSAQIADGSVTSADITDGMISNADISATAAITDTKIATITTAGKVADSALSANVSKLGATIDLGTAEVAGVLPDANVADSLSINNGRLFAPSGAGNVGIGTTVPSEKLHVVGAAGVVARLEGIQPYLMLNNTGSTFHSGIEFRSGGARKWSIFVDTGGFSQNNLSFRDTAIGETRLFIDPSGKVGIGTGTTVPDAKLHVGGGSDCAATSTTGGYIITNDGSSTNVCIDNNEILARNNGAPAPLYLNAGSGNVIVPALQITGGSDLAEPFDIRDAQLIQTGMVVAIDTERPGHLRIASTAYDRTVAGIISGANGVNPGLTMSQEGTVANGSLPVALSGRVYVYADTAYGAIQPGDLLTTSDTPGHAMKVTDYAKAHGAIIGKAMTTLKEGRGFVLVLVSLQ